MQTVLSRLPMSQSAPTPPVPGDTIMLLEKMEEFPVNVSQIWTWTNKGPLSSLVRETGGNVVFQNT